jgi:hypothetical protein
MRREKSRSQAPMSGAAPPSRSQLTRNRPATHSGTLASTGMSIPNQTDCTLPRRSTPAAPSPRTRADAPRPARPSRDPPAPPLILVVPGPPRQRRIIAVQGRPRRRCASAWSSCARVLPGGPPAERARERASQRGLARQCDAARLALVASSRQDGQTGSWYIVGASRHARLGSRPLLLANCTSELEPLCTESGMEVTSFGSKGGAGGQHCCERTSGDLLKGGQKERYADNGQSNGVVGSVLSTRIFITYGASVNCERKGVLPFAVHRGLSPPVCSR